MAFTPRTNETGIWQNPYWYDRSYNPGAYAGIWLPNCTTMAYGRAVEISGGQVGYSTIFGGGFRNAAQWYSEAVWSKSPGVSDLKLGDIICFGQGGGIGLEGHVATIEGIESGRIWISQSHDTPLDQTASFPGLQSQRYFDYGYLDLGTMIYHQTYHYNASGAYDTNHAAIYMTNCLGTIHNPYADQEPPEPPIPPGDDEAALIYFLINSKKKGGSIVIK